MGQITTSANAHSLLERRSGADVEGERFETDTRLVVAPSGGVFEPARDFRSGNTVAVGQVVGHLTAGATRTPVVSPFAGQTGAPLAWAGERLVPHQPVMWLSLESSAP